MDYLKTLYSSARALLVAYVAGGAISAQAQIDPDTAAWNETVSVGTPEAFQSYLDKFPTGRNAGAAFRNIVESSIAESRGEPGSGASTAGIGAVGSGVLADLY